MKLKRTNFHYILEMMIDGKEITASQVNGVSNANAYFVELEKKGHEGAISALYFDAIKIIIAQKYDFSARITKGAKDLVNSMLNYGYAVLYSKVQSALISAGLYLNISFYHVSAKFSLSFDLIEEFRVIVDQIVVALISKNADLAIKNGLLDEKTKKLLSQKISLAFLSNYHYKCEKQSLENIIAHQAVLLRRQILNEAKYKGFLVRF